MKYVLFIFCVAFVACEANKPAAIKSFISGVYVKYAESQYSKAWDTLRIAVYDAGQNTYSIEQHTGYQRIVDNKLQPKAYKSSTAMAVYDASTQQLQQMTTGRLFTFSPERATVIVGNAVYQKVN